MDASEELKQINELLDINRRVKHEFDKQIALFQAQTEPAIKIQQENVEKEIKRMEGLKLELMKASEQITQNPITDQDILNMRTVTDAYKIVETLEKSLETTVGMLALMTN